MVQQARQEMDCRELAEFCADRLCGNCGLVTCPHNLKNADFQLNRKPHWMFERLVWKLKVGCAAFGWIVNLQTVALTYRTTVLI